MECVWEREREIVHKRWLVATFKYMYEAMTLPDNNKLYMQIGAQRPWWCCDNVDNHYVKELSLTFNEPTLTPMALPHIKLRCCTWWCQALHHLKIKHRVYKEESRPFRNQDSILDPEHRLATAGHLGTISQPASGTPTASTVLTNKPHHP